MPRGKPVPRPVTIYALTDPETGRPRYVGHTTRLADRVGSHWCTRGKNPQPVSVWLGSLSDPPPYAVLEADVPFEERYEAEAFWTILLRQRGEKLLNLCVGAQISPEHARKSNAARRQHLAAKRLRLRGLHPVEEVTP
ncbi:GIY-YIG nuclease family protein [Streptomyces anandii]|uniref:GIY-YIG nuclease family protein n=1 Tax=Streptomyces anandii TaxID=285454 RepID=UPI00167544F5|nr:GIY-YIG nuclease family protein [Streptomyces anandii]GGX94680.1 hypothetical protein GCM10010510_44860 [Streptomyces anandii JCM 4720]